MIRFVLAEDEHLTRDAVARLLDMETDLEIVGQASTGAECPSPRRTRSHTDAIAAAVHLSPGTVRNYLSSAMHKLDTRNRAEAAARVRDHGWI